MPAPREVSFRGSDGWPLFAAILALPNGILGSIAMDGSIRSAEDLAEAFAAPIRDFIAGSTGGELPS
jgi:hypothetical protein